MKVTNELVMHPAIISGF